MRIETVDSHSFDAERLGLLSLVLDVGCRDYKFKDGMTERECVVLTIDADETIAPDLCAALVGEGKPDTAYYIAAQEAGRVVFENNPTLKPVPTVTIRQLANRFGRFDLVKMDIEGAEYDVLLTWPGPVAKQISIEFHEHSGFGKGVHGEDIYERIEAHLGQWYDWVKKDQLPCGNGLNYYDALFVLK